MDRKTFMFTSLRFLILSIFTAFVIFLFKRDKISVSGICEENKFCNNCKIFSQCEKPQALKQKVNEK